MPSTDRNSSIATALAAACDLKRALRGDAALPALIGRAVDDCLAALRGGGKVLFCGNGGSAADAQHLAAELSGRFYYDRPPLFSEALHVNTSYLTAVSNDYDFSHSFARMTTAMIRPGDVLFCLSTSGNSPNVTAAAEAARAGGGLTVGLTGSAGGRLAELADYCFQIPSTDTPRIQEAHMLIGHTICQLIEAEMFPR